MNAGIIESESTYPNGVDNKELETMMDTSDEWIRTRTGIEEKDCIG